MERLAKLHASLKFRRVKIMLTPDSLENRVGLLMPARICACLFLLMIILGGLSIQAQTPTPSLTPLPIQTPAPSPTTIVVSPTNESNTASSRNPPDADKTLDWTLRDAITGAWPAP